MAAVVAVLALGSSVPPGAFAGRAEREQLAMDPSLRSLEPLGDPRPPHRSAVAPVRRTAVVEPVLRAGGVREAPPRPRRLDEQATVVGRALPAALLTFPVDPVGAPVPAAALRAYRAAERRLAEDLPGCRLGWPLLAAIGQVESDHGRVGGRTVDREGRSWPAIVGLPLDGTRGTALVPDSDAGSLDGDRRFDRAVGPLQFIPGTWRIVAVDGDGDGRSDPQDLDDAALAAGVYLCASGEVQSPEGRARAVFRYNRSAAYVATVLELARRYAGGPVPVLPDAPAGEPVVPASPRPARLPLPHVPTDVGPASPTVPQPVVTQPATATATADVEVQHAPAAGSSSRTFEGSTTASSASPLAAPAGPASPLEEPAASGAAVLSSSDPSLGQTCPTLSPQPALVDPATATAAASWSGPSSSPGLAHGQGDEEEISTEPPGPCPPSG